MAVSTIYLLKVIDYADMGKVLYQAAFTNKQNAEECGRNMTEAFTKQQTEKEGSADFVNIGDTLQAVDLYTYHNG